MFWWWWWLVNPLQTLSQGPLLTFCKLIQELTTNQEFTRTWKRTLSLTISYETQNWESTAVMGLKCTMFMLWHFWDILRMFLFLREFLKIQSVQIIAWKKLYLTALTHCVRVRCGINNSNRPHHLNSHLFIRTFLTQHWDVMHTKQGLSDGNVNTQPSLHLNHSDGGCLCVMFTCLPPWPWPPVFVLICFLLLATFCWVVKILK